MALLLLGYLLITISQENAIKQATDRALSQYQYDKFTVQAILISNAENLPTDGFESYKSLADNVSSLTAFFTEDKSLLYSDIPPEIDLSMLNDMLDNTVAYQFQTVGGQSYILVCGRLTRNDVTLYLLTAADVGAVIEQKERMLGSLSPVYFITLGVSMFFMLALSALITRPLNRMRRAVARIARGQYHERLQASGGDEIGELSSNFNLMADAIENKISELIDTARQKEEFVANFAHELKTPMTSVIGYADMLYQKTLPPERAKAAAWYILNEGLRLEALSLKLLDLIVLNRQDFTLEETQTEVLFANILTGTGPMFEEKEITLDLNVHPATVKVEYDLFKTLLLNLIDNAIKAGSDRIGIIGRGEGAHYHVSVVDNGRGIPEGELGRVTEAFYMVDKSRSRKQHGAGLGLALASKIAEIHGASLTITSSEGAGTTVSFALPYMGGEDGE